MWLLAEALKSRSIFRSLSRYRVLQGPLFYKPLTLVELLHFFLDSSFITNQSADSTKAADTNNVRIIRTSRICLGEKVFVSRIFATIV